MVYNIDTPISALSVVGQPRQAQTLWALSEAMTY